MANDLNQCQFIGRLGKDPEVRYLPTGGAVASFSLAVGSTWKDKNSGEKKEHTEWVNITAFGKLGEICGEYLKKGSQVFIQGKLKTDKYDKDGHTHYSTKVIADNMQMLGGRSAGDNQNDRQSSGGQGRVNNPNDGPTDGGGGGFDDDIPFAPVRWDSY